MRFSQPLTNEGIAIGFGSNATDRERLRGPKSEIRHRVHQFVIGLIGKCWLNQNARRWDPIPAPTPSFFFPHCNLCTREVDLFILQIHVWFRYTLHTRTDTHAPAPSPLKQLIELIRWRIHCRWIQFKWFFFFVLFYCVFCFKWGPPIWLVLRKQSSPMLEGVAVGCR